MIKKPDKHFIKEVLKHSNWVERVYEKEALEDSLRAWRWAYKNIDNIDLKYVLKVHRLLLRRLNPRIAGEIRRCDVFIGGYKKFFISIQLLEEEIASWCRICDTDKIKNLRDTKKEEIIKGWHITIENFHPHEDGNGRLYRLIMNIHRIKAGLNPLLIRGWSKGDEKFHADQKEYYKWFLNK